MGSAHDFFYPKLILLVLGCWSSVSTYLLPLFRYLTRFTRNDGFSKDLSDDSQVGLAETDEESSNEIDPNTELEENQDFVEFSSVEDDGVDGKQPEFSFTFKFPTFEEFITNKKDFSHLFNFIEPSDVSKMNFSKFDDGSKAQDHSEEQKEEDAHEVVSENSNEKMIGEVDETEEIENSNENLFGKVREKEEIGTIMEDKMQNIHQDSVSTSVGSNTDSINSKEFHSSNAHLVDGFLSDGDFEAEFVEKEEESDWANTNFLSEKDFDNISRNIGEFENKNVDDNEENSSNDMSNKMESLWEQQDLIEQLKMEIKKVRATGLATIFEESESSPKVMEELKPWKIEEMYINGGEKMDEVHKFYKSYKERMRKFDIFSYQKMYSIGLLQLKDPLKSISNSKSSIPEITTLLSQSYSKTKGKKQENDPTIKFIKELQSDLEVVYVGQMCLSWEILHWQYEKALDIWESDPRRVRHFNEVAGEFQQFQVLMQRFLEDEPFQGPRVQNYVKTRCTFRNLLQVPLIREDSSKNKRKARSEGVYHISSDMLVEILEESIRIFWSFVRADKDTRKTAVDFQKAEDSQFFMEVQKDLQKKERKLKEELRSGNCILQRFRSCREEDDDREIDEVIYFFCQVDMKLVTRVLHMSRLTNDQLIWCQNKLNQISFVDKKMSVDPTFLLFPC